MHLLDSYAQTFLAINQVRSDTQKEQFKIAAVSLLNNKFNITVQNTGQIPINITRMWVQNTTTTNWVAKYQISSTVSPGWTISNIGTNIPGSINTAKAYYVKLVTSRGNTQAFTVNSASTAPLNIQLLALPSTIPSGFTTELVMIVTNNGSGTLTNLVPQITEQSGFTAKCTIGTVSPVSYNTLSPGNTAIFKWDLTASGTSGGQSCTWIAQLQNGYTGNTAQATVTVTTVSLSSTTYAQNAGLLTIAYTTFQWIQSSQWNLGWAIPGGQYTAFSIQMQNNNVTSPNINLYLSQESQVVLYNPKNSAAQQFYIAQGITPGPSGFTISPYNCSGPPSNDYCVSIPAGGSVTLYFAQFTPGNTVQQQKMPATGTDGIAFIVIYGKFSNSQNGAGNQYGQTLPFIGILAT